MVGGNTSHVSGENSLLLSYTKSKSFSDLNNYPAVPCLLIAASRCCTRGARTAPTSPRHPTSFPKQPVGVSGWSHSPFVTGEILCSIDHIVLVSLKHEEILCHRVRRRADWGSEKGWLLLGLLIDQSRDTRCLAGAVRKGRLVHRGWPGGYSASFHRGLEYLVYNPGKFRQKAKDGGRQRDEDGWQLFTNSM